MTMTSPEEFVALRTSHRAEEYQRAATDTASLEVWLEIIGKYPEMRIWVAHNKTVPIEILLVLARDPDADVRATVAMKNKLTADLLELLAQDSDDFVRQRIACNKNTPLALLMRLANDPSELVSKPAAIRVSAAHP